ncbi:MAG: 5-oxoprolinase subunit PxpA [Bauldia sp.]|nr:5-oxoprolinase subunit PxpA [Bauldia sp.]
MNDTAPRTTLNCDMGESFGIYRFGADEELMAYIDVANVACGFHGSDFNHMRNTVRLAKANDVAVGAHPSLPDMQGFGRRVMAISREELRNCLLYQIGALSAFLKAEDVPLNHIKPHGALYGMAARDPEVAHAIADVADIYPVPIFGLPGTLHETIYRERGHAFVPEFFADLDYDDEGHVIITREHPPIDPALVDRRIVDAVENDSLTTIGGKSHPVQIETICVHSDTPNAVELAAVITKRLRALQP